MKITNKEKLKLNVFKNRNICVLFVNGPKKPV